VIIIMVLVINVLSAIGTDGSFEHGNSENSVLAEISRDITPAFAPMGIKQDNWPAVLGVLSGVLAKEVVVGTLDTLYSSLARENTATPAEDTFDFWATIESAFASIPENLAGVAESLEDPLHLDVSDMSSEDKAAQTLDVDNATFGAMTQRFDGQAGAFAYLLFVLLYFPCVATIGAIKREAGRSWALFVAAWTTLVAYITATGFYQIATYAQHPGSSVFWLSTMFIIMAAIIIGLRQWAHRGNTVHTESDRANGQANV
jgi:ferrous iron transport protein B